MMVGLAFVVCKQGSEVAAMRAEYRVDTKCSGEEYIADPTAGIHIEAHGSSRQYLRPWEELLVGLWRMESRGAVSS